MDEVLDCSSLIISTAIFPSVHLRFILYVDVSMVTEWITTSVISEFT